MKKDAEYYEARMIEKSNVIYKNEIANLPDEEALEKIDHFNDELSYQAMLTRIAYNFTEAKEIIKQLANVSENEDPDKIYDLTWVAVSSKKMPFGGEVMTAKMTKKEMIKNLEAIASEEFGEDLDEWQSWLAAFEKNPPPRGFR